MQRRTGAQLVCESLLHERVATVFGIPGGSVIPLYHSLADYPIHHVLMRHEQGAVHAADGYARATGSVGVCLTTSGPGATNLATGLATAYVAGAPIVALCGQSPLRVLGTDAFQEVDIVSLTEPVTKHNYLVAAAQEIPQVMKEAFHIARTGRPGPVLVVVANDVQKDECESADPEQTRFSEYDPVEQSCSPDREGRRSMGEAACCTGGERRWHAWGCSTTDLRRHAGRNCLGGRSYGRHTRS